MKKARWHVADGLFPIPRLPDHSNRLLDDFKQLQIEPFDLLDRHHGQRAERGGIRGVGIATRDGTDSLKALPDGSEGNNLGSLPTIIR